MSVLLIVTAVCVLLGSLGLWWADREPSLLAIAVFFGTVAIHEILANQRPGVVAESAAAVTQFLKIVSAAAFVVLEYRHRKVDRRIKNAGI